MKHKNNQYLRVEKLIEQSDVFNGDPAGGVFKGKPYPFILKNNLNNLYAPVLDEIISYFKSNRIAWWGGKLTNHTLSSQVACLNHLFPIREDKRAVLSMIQNIEPDIEDVLVVSSDQYKPAYISFEAVSDEDHLNELTSTRGSNCTSVDALVFGVHKDGRKILFPIEWKYVEAYNNDNKARGEKGITRQSRYHNLIHESAQLRKDNLDIFYFEPFYQLMRQTLWAEQIIAHKDVETIKADDYIHIHVIPSENNELLHKVYPCSGKIMEDTWRSCIIDQSKYVIIAPKKLLTSIDPPHRRFVISYLKARYW